MDKQELRQHLTEAVREMTEKMLDPTAQNLRRRLKNRNMDAPLVRIHEALYDLEEAGVLKSVGSGTNGHPLRYSLA